VDPVTRAARSRPALFLASATAAGAIVVAALLAGRMAERRATCRSALIPAYGPPQTIAALARTSARPRLVVVNPSNGPGAEPDAGYGDAVRAARRAGARVLGYVPTTYGVRPAADIARDVDRYAAWYRVDGVFFDEAAHAAALVPYYAGLARQARARGARLVVLNPGVVPAPGYFDVADVVVTYEGPYAAYAAALRAMPSWVRKLPAERVAHLVYSGSREQALAAARLPDGPGHLYATSGAMPDPWQTLPAYLHEEERVLEACS
jgi:spherulation-specific family 4 protein